MKMIYFTSATENKVVECSLLKSILTAEFFTARVHVMFEIQPLVLD